MNETLAGRVGSGPGDPSAHELPVESDDLFRLAVENAPFGMCLASPHGRFLAVNAAFCSMFGLEPEALLGRTWRDLAHPDDEQRYQVRLGDLMNGRTHRCQQRLRCRRADSSEGWADLTTSCVRGADGCLRFLVVQAVDVTAQVASEQLLGAILQAQAVSLAVLTAVRDADGRIVDFTFDDASDILRTAAPGLDADGTRLSILLPSAGTSDVLEAFRHVMETGETLDRDFQREDATLGGWIHCRAVRVGDRLVVSTQDITQRKAAEAALRRSEAMRDRAERVGGIGSWRLDLTTRRFEWSLGMFALVDAEPHELGGDPERIFAARVHPEDWPTLQARREALFCAVDDSFIALRVIHRDGSVHALEGFSEVEYEDGRAVAVIGGMRDVTTRHEAEEALRRRVTELNAVQRLLELLAQSLDLRTALNSASRLLADLFTARSVKVRVHPNGGEGYVAGFGERRAADRAAEAATLAILEAARNEREIPAPDRPRLLALPLVAHGDMVGALAVVRDNRSAPFTELDKTVARTAADLLAAAVWTERFHRIQAQQATVNERQRLAQDLHDSALQSIYSASLMAEALPKACASWPDNCRDDFLTLRRLIRAALAEMRTLLFELRPETFAAALLEAQLEGLADALEGRGDISVELALDEAVSLPEKARMVFFRTAQEALRNIARHADAEHVSVTLNRDGDLVRLIVRDDGDGFEASTTRPATVGLNAMRERARGIGADLRIESTPGAGTTIDLMWPAPAGAGTAG